MGRASLNPGDLRSNVGVWTVTHIVCFLGEFYAIVCVKRFTDVISVL